MSSYKVPQGEIPTAPWLLSSPHRWLECSQLPSGAEEPDTKVGSVHTKEAAKALLLRSSSRAVGRIVHSLVCRRENEKAPHNSFIFKNQRFRATLSNLDYTLEPSVVSPPQIRVYLGLGKPGRKWEEWEISLGDHKHCCGRCVTHPRTVLWGRSGRSQGKKSCSPQQPLGSAPDYKLHAMSSSRQRGFGIRKILVQISPLPLNSPWGSEQITWADLWFHLAQMKGNNLHSL